MHLSSRYMAIFVTLSPELEALLRDKAARLGQNVDLVASRLLANALEWEVQDSQEAIKGIQQGLDDFGVVYEETQIFLNRLYSEGLYQQAFAANLNIADNRGVGNLVKFVHQGFLSPADLTDSLENEGSLLKNIPVQWLMPQKFITLALQICPIRLIHSQIRRCRSCSANMIME